MNAVAADQGPGRHWRQRALHPSGPGGHGPRHLARPVRGHGEPGRPAGRPGLDTRSRRAAKTLENSRL